MHTYLFNSLNGIKAFAPIIEPNPCKGIPWILWGYSAIFVLNLSTAFGTF
jgi:hypothetical protein